MKRAGTQGSLLIVVSWTLFFLGGLAVAISTYVSANMREAARGRDELAVDACAASLVARTLAHARADTNAWDAPVEEWRTAPDLWRIEIDGAVGVISGGVWRADGTFEHGVGLIDEEGKINVRSDVSNARLVQTLLRRVGGVASEEAVALEAALRAAQEPISDELTNGASTGYSAVSGRETAALGRPLRSIYELRLIKGWTPEVVDRVLPFVTVFGEGRVNVNAAAARVLECLALASEPTLDAAAAARVAGVVLAYRERGRAVSSAESMAELLRTAGLTESREIEALRRLMVYPGGATPNVKSDVFSGLCVSERGKARRHVEFVFDRNRGELLWWYER